MNPCPDRETLLQALLDGELDAANVLAAEAHLRTCPGCSSYYQTLQALRTRLAEADLAEAAPPGLRSKIEAMIEAESRPAAARRRAWWARPAPARERAGWNSSASPVGSRALWTASTAGWSTAAAMTAVAASLMVAQWAGPPSATLQDQLVASHVRSLEASHLIDVATSDRHVVKPWFNGKISFAPPVIDLSDQGFPLVGGRLDYAGDQEVAALVYRRHAHVINLFIMPARPHPLAWLRRGAPTSYSVVHWTRDGLDFWAVSDVDAGQLDAFHQAFAARAAG
jgi:anti-sigma factor RsiW